MAIYGTPVLERSDATPIAPEIPSGFNPEDAAFLESAGISAETTRAHEVAQAVGAVILNDQDPSNYVALGVARVPGIRADEAPNHSDIQTVLARESAKVAERRGWRNASVYDAAGKQIFMQRQVEQAKSLLDSINPPFDTDDDEDSGESKSSRS